MIFTCTFPCTCPGYMRPAVPGVYHTLQECAGIIGWPTLQPNALPKASKFCTTPLTRHSPGECGSVFTRTRASIGAVLAPDLGEEMKNRCAGV